MRTAILSFALMLVTGAPGAATLRLETKIALPGGQGRIDHLAFDAKRGVLFVAELGNDSVAVIDLRSGRVLRRLMGMKEPQGLAFHERLNRLYVASGGDGMVRAYDARNFDLLRSSRLGSDADNIRFDSNTDRLYVGYGDGALGILDAGSLEKIGDVALKGHPESFQLSTDGALVYANVPDAGELAVVDRLSQKQVASWPAKWHANYPMALDDGEVLAVFRQPANIARYAVSGTLNAAAAVCGDADDVFVDPKRARIYVICGEGRVDVLDRKSLHAIDRFTTLPGARTGFYSAESDSLFVAVRAQAGTAAAVWVLKPVD